MAAGPVKLKHPAKMLYTLGSILSLFFILGHSCAPTSTCGMCEERTNSPLNEYRCEDNDADQVGSMAEITG